MKTESVKEETGAEPLNTEEQRFITFGQSYRNTPHVPVPGSSSAAGASKAQTTRRTVNGPSGMSDKGMANLKREGIRKMVKSASSKRS